MKFSKLIANGVLIAGLGAGSAAFADHMSPWGEDWANMPNDTHDTRIDTLDDEEAWLDYIGASSGGGASSDTARGGGSDTARGGPNR